MWKGWTWTSSIGCEAGTYRSFVKEAVSVDENVCVYQCRGRASVFRTGHCVGFVVDLQGGSVEGRDMTHTHFSDTHTLSHSWLYVKNAGTAHPLFIQIPDGLVVNLFKVSTMYIYIPKYPMYARWSNSHDPSWKFCKGEEWNQQSAGASCSAPCYRLSPGDWAVWYPNNWRTISGASFWKWKPRLLLSYTPPPIFNKAHSDSVSPDSLGSKRNPSRFKRTTHRGFQPDVPSSPSLVVWVFPGLSENLPHHLIWLTPRWWSVDSCAPFCAFCVQDIRP